MSLSPKDDLRSLPCITSDDEMLLGLAHAFCDYTIRTTVLIQFQTTGSINR